MLQRSILLFGDVYNKLETKGGEILFDEKYKGSVFCGGLFVSKVGELKYGYNIKPKYLRLDRDRRILDWYETRWVTSRMWGEVFKENKGPILEMMKEDRKDIEFIEYEISSSEASEISVDFFKDKTDHFPIAKEEDRKRVELFTAQQMFRKRGIGKLFGKHDIFISLSRVLLFRTLLPHIQHLNINRSRIANLELHPRRQFTNMDQAINSCLEVNKHSKRSQSNNFAFVLSTL